jgi:Fe(3+) dicitrate transport protein
MHNHTLISIASFSVLGALIFISSLNAQDTLTPRMLPVVSIVDTAKGRLFREHPGSVSVLGKQDIERMAPVTGNEVFRRIPGLQVVDEEGAGLRINIGVRGLDPDRSRNILILEDGIPVALNPYGEPEMYYTPAMDRMEGVEVLKGSGQIVFGPQTVGGVINYITSKPPAGQGGSIRLSGGQGGLFTAMANYGGTFGTTGIQISVLRKQANAMGYANFALNDINTKFVFRTGEHSDLTVKIGLYEETSNATYIGLTQTMFDAVDQDFTLMAPDDRLNIMRASVGAIYRNRLRKNLEFKTTAFAYGVTRNWRRQDFRTSPGLNTTGIIWGDTTVAGGAVFMQNQTGNRNRQFLVAGVEPSISWDTKLGIVKNNLHVGIRLMHETALEQRINGSFPTAVSGNLRDEEIRTGIALAGYFQNRVSVGERLQLVPGLRVENYNFVRDIHRASGVDTLISGEDAVLAFIPGFGASYLIGKNVNVFSGIHRGFSPPRLKDAIANDGTVYQLEPELSWNIEAGTRWNPLHGLSLEATLFYMAFENQIIPVSQSAGGQGAGLVNAGATRHMGAELMAGMAFHDMGKNWNGHKLGLDLALTYVDARLASDRFVTVDGETVNISGNRTPYAPEFTGSAGVWYETPFGLGFQTTLNAQSAMFGDVQNTIAPTANGRVGEIEGRVVTDLTIFYTEKKTRLRFHLAVKNITDERYVATRRPQGIRVGLPRFFSGGVTWQFGRP